jgi:hypothetical protein
MWSKIFIIALIAAILPMNFLTYYSWDWLSSIGSPAAVVENYAYYSSLGWMFLWVSTIVLLILANAVLWQIRRSWALWSTLVYFVFFVVVKSFWLERSFASYAQQHGVYEKSMFSGILLAIAICVAAVVIVFFNELIAIRLNKKIYPPIESNAEILVDPAKSKSSE